MTTVNNLWADGMKTPVQALDVPPQGPVWGVLCAMPSGKAVLGFCQPTLKPEL